MACKVTAIVTYYSFLSSFSWLLLIAFDVWYALRLTVTRLRIVSRQSRRYAFITYSVLGWLLFPVILVSAALFMEYLQDEPTFQPRLVAQCIAQIQLLLTKVIPQNLQLNHLTPNGHYMGRIAQLTSRCCILYIYSTNIRTEYFKHAA